MPRSAAPISLAEANRSSGRLAIERSTTAASELGTSERASFGFGRLLEVRVQGRDLVLAMKRRASREALEQHAPERIDVRTAVDGVAADLLGGDVL